MSTFQDVVQPQNCEDLPGQIASHPFPLLPMLFNLEPLFITNYLWMPQEVRRSIDDGLSPF